jgi:hypothetical protein
LPKPTRLKPIAEGSAISFNKVEKPDNINDNPFISFSWGWYLLSFFVPFAGIFIALFLFEQDAWEVRKVGRNCLLTGFMIWVVFPFIVVLGLLLLGILAAAGLASDIMSAG